MARIARIVYNTNGWISPTKSDKKGVFVNQPGNNYYFGLEEWLFNPEFINRKIGYLDCYRNNIFQIEEKVLIVTKNLMDNCYYHVATLFEVSSINELQINTIRASLGNVFLQEVENNFNAHPINDARIINNHEYYNNWNSNNIIADAPNGFIANIKYKSFKFNDTPENLTVLDPMINIHKIDRLSVLYTTDKIMRGNLNIKLKKYLSTQI